MNRNDPVLTDDIRKADTWFELPAAGYVLADAKKAKHFRFVPNQACTFGVTNATSGRRILIRVEQPASGGFAVTLDGAITAGTVTISTTASAVTMFELIWDEFLKTWYAYAYGGGGSSGANTGLTNLTSVAVNTSLVSDTDNTDDLGTSSIYWRQVFVGDTIVMKNATKIQANSGSSGTIYFDTAAIHLSFSAKPVSLWTGTFLGFDEAVSLGATPGTTGFGMNGANFECKYTNTVAWRLESATTMFLNDCNLKLSATTGTKLGTTAAQKLGFWGATPVVQQAAIADATDAADAVTKLNTLLATLRTLGIIAT